MMNTMQLLFNWMVASLGGSVAFPTAGEYTTFTILATEVHESSGIFYIFGKSAHYLDYSAMPNSQGTSWATLPHNPLAIVPSKPLRLSTDTF
jgi:hypothetical protein